MKIIKKKVIIEKTLDNQWMVFEKLNQRLRNKMTNISKVLTVVLIKSTNGHKSTLHLKYVKKFKA